MISCDANAGGRLRPEAQEAMAWLMSHEGEVRNASSVHGLGRKTRGLLDQAREAVKVLVGGGRVVFTSGGTEACNAMVWGFVGKPGHVICSRIEHPAILESIKILEQRQWQVSWINPGSDGIVRVEDMLAELRQHTALVVLMLANNETGAIQPVVDLAQSLRKQGYTGAIVSDMTQALGKMKITAEELFVAGVNAVSISGHKIGAPSGIGALVLGQESQGSCFQFDPLIVGGPQEERFRAGTENLFGAVGFGAVAKVLQLNLGSEIKRMAILREDLWNGISTRVPGIKRLTPLPEEGKETCLSNTLLLQVDGCRGDDLVVALDLKGVAISTGAACASGKQEVSHVVQAMGLSKNQAKEVVRFSLDWDADQEIVGEVIKVFGEVVERMRTSFLK